MNTPFFHFLPSPGGSEWLKFLTFFVFVTAFFVPLFYYAGAYPDTDPIIAMPVTLGGFAVSAWAGWAVGRVLERRINNLVEDTVRLAGREGELPKHKVKTHLSVYSVGDEIGELMGMTLMLKRVLPVVPGVIAFFLLLLVWLTDWLFPNAVPGARLRVCSSELLLSASRSGVLFSVSNRD
jgi:hypothetical protein